MKSLSIVISAYNEEKNLFDCLDSVKDIASEIIVVDNESQDKTVEVAKKFTKKVYTRKNNLMLNINKNFGISKATSDWILLLDADERVTKDLANEIKSKMKNEKLKMNGYSMPRKNIIFGKWIQHTGWYPDRQLRLFKKGSARFEEKHVHEMITVDGEVGELEHPLYHLNYEDLSQFLDKMIRIYTISEAENLINSGYKVVMRDAIRMPAREFVKRFFAEKGYRDGAHGLALSCLMAFYHLVVFLRVWEARSYPGANAISEFKEGSRDSAREFKFWMRKAENDNEKNTLKKLSKKVIQKFY